MGYRRDDGQESVSPRVRRIRRVLWGILALNLGVAFAKLGWGTVSGSVAMRADGFHSLFDGTSNVVGLVGMYLSARPADREHPYGHGKYQTYAAAAIGGMLAFAAYNVGTTALNRLASGGDSARVDAMSFVVMIGTLCVNLAVTAYERRVGSRLRSEILVADAKHTGSDVLVSVGVIIGLVAVRLGYPVADPVLALAVAVAIGYTAWGVFRQAVGTLSDTARLDPAAICAVVREVPGVLGCHNVRTRGSESEVYVDMHIQVDPTMTVGDGHRVAEAAERAVCDHFDVAVDVIAHLEPLDSYQASKTAEEIDAGLA